MRRFPTLAIPFILCAFSFAANIDVPENEFFHVLAVSDPDGYVNVRSSPNATGEVVACIQSGTISHVDDFDLAANNWWKINTDKKFLSKSCSDSLMVDAEMFAANQIDRNLFVHSSRFKRLTEFAVMRRISISTSQYRSVAKFDSFELELATRKFTKKNKMIKIGESTNGTVINGDYAWGTEYTLPFIETVSLRIRHGISDVAVDKDAYSNLYELSLDDAVIFKGENGLLYLGMTGGDAAASYFVILTIRGGKVINFYKRLSYFA